jgi:hypothetical protein
MSAATTITLIETLRARKADLKARLDTGATRIEEAQQQGQNVSDWEEHWVELLRCYEQISDKLKLLEEAEGEGEKGQE